MPAGNSRVRGVALRVCFTLPSCMAAHEIENTLICEHTLAQKTAAVIAYMAAPALVAYVFWHEQEVQLISALCGSNVPHFDIV